MNYRSCCAKFATGLNIIIRHNSKSIWVIKLSFCQNVSPMGGSFWQKDSLITHILFDLWLILIFSPVTIFAQQSLCNKKSTIYIQICYELVGTIGKLCPTLYYALNEWSWLKTKRITWNNNCKTKLGLMPCPKWF